MNSKAVDLNLLSSFHPRESFATRTALEQGFKFIILAVVWLSLIFLAAAGAGVAFAWKAPFVFNELLPMWFPAVDKQIFADLADIHAYLAPTVVVATIIPVNALFMVLCERKFLSLLTMRIGPDKVGPNGGLQTLADAFKLLFKEDTMPKGADPILFTLAPALFFAPSMIVFLPLLAVASNRLGAFVYTDLDISLIFILGFVSLGTMSLVMAGWASNNKYSLMGGLRAAAQAVSYEIPLVLTMIAIIMLSGSVNLVKISDSQAGGILNWNLFGHGKLPWLLNLTASSGGNFFEGFVTLVFIVLCALLFIIFVTAATAEVNRIPFDIPEAESELVSGFNTEFSGMKFALFFLAEYTNLFISSGLAAILFLGGSHLPISAASEQALYNLLSNVSFELPVVGSFYGMFEHLNLTWVLASITLLVKIYIMFLVAIWIRATLPRLRQDQLMEFGWKYLIPLSLGIIFILALVLEYIKL
ncbi:MAG: NADH-quinone oxidoreductase subunit H [Candidatus Caenarcaniphilales bacterium]|nr:NADH-quinone oxidoreductase subunit H [Candidatus Caenarcaniphilales bacterium]